MIFALFKWLLWFCTPFAWLLGGLLLLSLWLMWKRMFKVATAVLLLDLFMAVVCLPATSARFGMTLEGQYPPKALKDIPKADAIVLLGGSVGAIMPGVSPYPECFSAADRVVMAARLYHAGKAKVIIPSGGGALTAEKPLLETMQVPASAILCETEARDTAENATKTIALLKAKGYKKALIVTSSWHLPRAMMLFKSSEIELIPVGCDYEATTATAGLKHAPIWSQLPQPGTTYNTGLYFKEWLGILFYSFKKTPAEAPAKPSNTPAQKKE